MPVRVAAPWIVDFSQPRCEKWLPGMFFSMENEFAVVDLGMGSSLSCSVPRCDQ